MEISMELQKVFEAARKGCVSSLEQLLIDDASILDYNLKAADTPLHVAAKLGHIDFTKKLISIKPRLTKELNSQGSSPLHLASSEGHIEVVKALLSVDTEAPCMATVGDTTGLTPIHLAVINGRDEVVRVLVKAAVDDYQDEEATMTYGRWTSILHLCVVHGRLEPLKLILQAIPHFNTTSIMHLAVAYRQLEIIRFLSEAVVQPVQVNVALNVDGLQQSTPKPKPKPKPKPQPQPQPQPMNDVPSDFVSQHCLEICGGLLFLIIPFALEVFMIVNLS